MAVQCKFERSLVSFEEYEAISMTHHPNIQTLDTEDLRAATAHLRDMRDRERTHARHNSRVGRGKAEDRGGSFPGTAEKPLERKQVFSAALKRANKEFKRRSKFISRTAMMEAAQRALTLRQTAQPTSRPDAGYTANTGMRTKQSSWRQTKVPPSKIGSITHATKISQAIRDSR